jgi:hypothetical protein
MKHSLPRLALAFTALAALAGCQKADAPAPPAAQTPLKVTATIQDLMQSEVDPAADFLWASVSTTVTTAGTEEHQPRTDEEWLQVRHQAVILMEAANLLIMDGRRVAAPGKKLEDEGIQGILTAAEVQQKLEKERETFVGFAHALHDVGEQMLMAIDAKNVQGMIDAGEKIDSVCESCHLTFWYPGQVTFCTANPKQY